MRNSTTKMTTNTILPFSVAKNYVHVPCFLCFQTACGRAPNDNHDDFAEIAPKNDDPVCKIQMWKCK
jgi:hypothetical protein